MNNIRCRGTGLQACVTVNATGCGFDSVEAKCVVEYRHSTFNASRIWRYGERSVLILGSICLPYCVLKNIYFCFVRLCTAV